MSKPWLLLTKNSIDSKCYFEMQKRIHNFCCSSVQGPQFLKSRDPNVKYDWSTGVIYYKGNTYDLGAKAGYKLFEHYNTYIQDGDIRSAGETIRKFKHFFLSYNMGSYFSTYYRAIGEKIYKRSSQLYTIATSPLPFNKRSKTTCGKPLTDLQCEKRK